MEVKMKRITSLSVLFGLLLTSSLFLQSCNEELPDPAKGEALVNQLWDAFRNQDLEGIRHNMAPGFQSVHDFGACNMDEELVLLRGLAITEYSITGMKVTVNEEMIIATYFVAVSETINGERLSRIPAPRMTIFVEEDGAWKWAAHANLKPIQAEEQTGDQQQEPEEESDGN